MWYYIPIFYSRDVDIIGQLYITYEGRDITREISPFVTAFTFTDNSSGKADDISLTLMDRDSLWLMNWTPSKGDTITPSLAEGGLRLDCGAFTVDQIDYSFPPHIITIKAVSASPKTHTRFEPHSRSWEENSLSGIAGSIAQDNGLECFYDAQDYPVQFREQVQQADLPFLEELCGQFGLSLKISEGKLIIFSESGYSLNDPAASITPDDPRLISARFSSKSAGIYRKSRLTYHNPALDETFTAGYEDTDAEGTEQELEIFTHVDSQEQADAVAREALIRNNSAEITAQITLSASPEFLAGVNADLKGFGMFSGKYFTDKVTHTVAGGWTTTVTLKMGAEAKKSANRKKAKSRKQAATSADGKEILADDTEGY